MPHQGSIRLAARGIIIEHDRILVFRMKDADWWYFPGGGVDFGESIIDALQRETMEELGVTVRSSEYIGTIENFFNGGAPRHSLEIAFALTLAEHRDTALEPHEVCEWVPLERFKSMDVRPITLRDEVIQWLRTKRMFWKIERTKRHETSS